MPTLVLSLIPPAFLVALIVCGIVRAVSIKAGALDTAPMPGQVKAERRSIPNTGGIGIAAGLLGVLAIALIAGSTLGPEALPGWASPAAKHLEGLRTMLPTAWAFVLGGLWLHALGLIDDRRPLGPVLKLVCMALPAIVLAVFFETRLLTALDQFSGGPWLSVLVTVVWFLAITNAMNFMDNMDALCAGVATVAGTMFLAGCLLGGQWFVAALLALLVGACAGFLVWNRPPAKLFMGDGGSLLVGYTLAFATVRTTYIPEDGSGVSPWYAVLMPVVVLSVPLYDLISVTAIRLSQGRSPLVGDLQHFSHRLVERGLSKRAAVAVIVALSGATGVSGLLLSRTSSDWQAIAIGGQVVLLLAILGVFEHRVRRSDRAGSTTNG